MVCEVMGNISRAVMEPLEDVLQLTDVYFVIGMKKAACNAIRLARLFSKGSHSKVTSAKKLQCLENEICLRSQFLIKIFALRMHDNLKKRFGLIAF